MRIYSFMLCPKCEHTYRNVVTEATQLTCPKCHHVLSYLYINKDGDMELRVDENKPEEEINNDSD